jgi:thiamine kinase-like enzyme
MNLQTLNNISLFKNEELLSLEKLPIQGFCNINYKLKTSKDKYLVRVFKSDFSVNVSRNFEYKIQKKAWKKSIASKPLYLDKNKQFMITQLLQGFHKERLENKDLKRIVKVIKKLHKIKSWAKVYNLEKDFKYYKNILKDKDSKKIINSSLKEIKNLKKYKQTYVTTHHDLNSKNIIFYKNSIKFIDWEYAGKNSCFFDLASICVEFKLSNKQKRKLLNYYFKLPKNKHKVCLESYIKIYESLCKLWFKTLK